MNLRKLSSCRMDLLFFHGKFPTHLTYIDPQNPTVQVSGVFCFQRGSHFFSENHGPMAPKKFDETCPKSKALNQCVQVAEVVPRKAPPSKAKLHIFQNVTGAWFFFLNNFGSVFFWCAPRKKNVAIFSKQIFFPCTTWSMPGMTHGHRNIHGTNKRVFRWGQPRKWQRRWTVKKMCYFSGGKDWHNKNCGIEISKRTVYKYYMSAPFDILHSWFLWLLWVLSLHIII